MSNYNGDDSNTKNARRINAAWVKVLALLFTIAIVEGFTVNALLTPPNDIIDNIIALIISIFMLVVLVTSLIWLFKQY